MGRLRHLIIASVCFASASLAALPAGAQTQQQIDWCNGKDGAAPDLVIGGCTALIQSGKFSGKNLAIVFYLRGKAYRSKGESDKALTDLTQAIKLDPKHSLAYEERGGLYVSSKKDYQAALRDLALAIELAPNNSTAWAYQGDAFYGAGQDQSAIASFEQSIKLAPDWMWPANDRGELYADRGDYQEALRDFDHVVAVSAAYAMGWNNRCRVNAILGRLDQALKDCDEALKINPKFTNSMKKSGRVSARQHRAFVLLKAGRFDEAIQDYTLALDILSNAETLFGRGTAKLKKGDKAGADADIASAKALDPTIGEKFVGFGVKY
jgi:tetratricopeptide (TPR) repeat protein